MSGRRGPPPRPAELRRLEAASGGSLRQHAVPDVVLVGKRPDEAPAPPPGIRDTYALELWGAVTGALHELAGCWAPSTSPCSKRWRPVRACRRAPDVLEP